MSCGRVEALFRRRWRRHGVERHRQLRFGNVGDEFSPYERRFGSRLNADVRVCNVGILISFEVELRDIQDARIVTWERRALGGIVRRRRVAFEGKRAAALLGLGLRLLLHGGCAFFLRNRRRAAAAFMHFGFYTRDPPCRKRTDQAADTGHRERNQDARGRSERRGSHGYHAVDAEAHNRALDQSGTDGHAGQTEQGTEPEGDNGGKEGVPGNRLTSARRATLLLGHSSSSHLEPGGSGRAVRQRRRLLQWVQVTAFGKRLDNGPHSPPNCAGFQRECVRRGDSCPTARDCRAGRRGLPRKRRDHRV